MTEPLKQKYLDKNGKEIQPYDLLKVFHYIGARNKKHYMYKWAFEKEGYLCAYDLSPNNASYSLPRTDPAVPLQDYEIIQSPLTLKAELEKRRTTNDTTR